MEYIIYSPGGNDTALVLGDDFADKKAINDKIMTDHPAVEQVGFLSLKKSELTMAGGEFCGNATRCACHYYLSGKPGEIEIKTGGQSVKCGINDKGEVWIELPKPVPREIAKGIYLVEMDGITHIVIDKDKFETKGLGVIPIENGTINPFVWVRDINTFFNETACLSGTVAAAAVGARAETPDARGLRQTTIKQPSGAVYKVEYNGKIKVSGEVHQVEGLL